MIGDQKNVGEAIISGFINMIFTYVFFDYVLGKRLRVISVDKNYIEEVSLCVGVIPVISGITLASEGAGKLWENPLFQGILYFSRGWVNSFMAYMWIWFKRFMSAI
ncbi:hypothetical protein [Coxiella endosymbiont of Ornithodoros maritimus]|uniref:hypothetical protein n=1 Tax=Coxiella endosymbiont of Ornithodoros maritimus TaxID=1656172 RepID=UPI002264EC15|nr:hypothetical protein [Coxiella endosymbiont of Ornithodoros maritimus]